MSIAVYKHAPVRIIYYFSKNIAGQKNKPAAQEMLRKSIMFKSFLEENFCG